MGFNEDYFWTGGGFSDWSGNSAGKFDRNPGSDSCSPSGNCSSGGYIPPDKETEDQIRSRVLSEQKQKGLPKNADMLPVFLTKGQWLRRNVFLLFLLSLPLFGCLLFMNRPEPFVLWIGGFFYLTAVCWIVYLVKETPNRYPVQKVVTKRVVRRRLVIDEIFAIGSLLLLSVIPLCPLIFCLFEETIKMYPEIFVFESIYEIDDIRYWHYTTDSFCYLTALFVTIPMPLLYLLYHLYRIRHLLASADQRMKYIEYRQELHKKKWSELRGRYKELDERIRHIDNNYTDQEVCEWFELRKYWKDGNYGDMRDIGVPTSAETVNWSVYRQSNKGMYKFFGWLLIISSLIFVVVSIWGSRSRKHESERLYEQHIEYRQYKWNMLHHDDPVEEVETESSATMVDPGPVSTTPATSTSAPTKYKPSSNSSSKHSSGSSYHSSSYSPHNSSYEDDDEEDDDDTWYRDEDDADERDEYDYWE